MSLQAKIEAVIYASEEPVTLSHLIDLLGQHAQGELDQVDDRQGILGLGDPHQQDGKAAPAGLGAVLGGKDKDRCLREYFRTMLERLVAEYATPDRGMEIREVAGGFRMATKPEYHDTVRGFVKKLKPPLKLTLQALETLAVVAYKQPITSPEISEIRGVDSNGVLGSLMGRKLVTAAGRKQVVGRPILYKTTKDFLLRFGLKDITELPSIEEFEKLAGEFAEAEQREIPMGVQQEKEAVELERESISPQGDGDSSALDEAEPVDGRVSGLPPNYGADKSTDGSAEDAAIQSNSAQQ